MPPWSRRLFQRRTLITLAALSVLHSGAPIPSSRAQSQSPLEPQIEQHLQAAQQAERSKDYARAAEAYQKILELRPGWALIQQSLALTYHLRNLYPQAIAEFEKAIVLDDQLWGSYLFLGMDYYRTNQFDKAIPALEKSLALNPERAESEGRFWLGASYTALGKYPPAIEQFERLTATRRSDIELLYQLARSYDRYGLDLFETIGRIEPRSSFVHLLQAERYAAERRFDLAGLEYSRALELRPDLEGVVPALRRFDRTAAEPRADQQPKEPLEMAASDIRSNAELAEFFLSIGAGDQASKHGRRLARVEVKDPELETYVASVTQRLKQWQQNHSAPAHDSAGQRVEPGLLQALEAFQNGRFGTAVEGLTRRLERGDNTRLRLYLARAHLGLNQRGQSIAQLQKILDKEPQNVEALYWLGTTYRQWAASTMQRMIDSDPGSYRVQQLAGEAHEENTEYEKALESYRAALEKRPELAGIRYSLGNVYWKMRRYDEAEKWLVEELERNPHHGLAHLRLGSLYADQNKAGPAIAHLEQALAANPGLVTARLDLGRALMAERRYHEALSQFEAYAKADPANDRVHYLLANAYRKLGRLDQAKAAMAKYRELNRKRLERVQAEVKSISEELSEETQPR